MRSPRLILEYPHQANFMIYERWILAYNGLKSKKKESIDMQIQLRNEIQLDGQMEVVAQQFPVEVMKKNDQLYLIFTNEEKEKTIIKCDEEELVMTRFSNPKTVMRFMPEKEVIVTLHTPIGIQHFVTDTQHYQLDQANQSLALRYDLKQLEGNGVFASYQMEIRWR